MTESRSKALYEEREIRCPRLGGPVTFAYCRVENAGRPCPRTIVCWQAYFDAETFFREIMTPEEFAETFLQPPRPKMATLIELIEQAKKLAEEKRAQQDTEKPKGESPEEDPA
ncbi:MAG: hypothetical protein FJ118_16380 [Deltaproteobacteria bacterium]|nr:hypothetical protein [Deltaproteobacteria bacterium]